MMLLYYYNILLLHRNYVRSVKERYSNVTCIIFRSLSELIFIDPFILQLLADRHAVFAK